MAFYQKQRCKCDFFFTWPLNPPATTKSSNPSAGTASYLIHSPVNFVRRFVSINDCHHITSITPIKVIFSSLCFNLPKMICKTPYTKEIRWMKRKDDDDNLIIAWSRRNEKQEAQKSMPTKEWKKILITMNKEQTNKRWRGWNEWPKPFSFSVSDYPFPMTSKKKDKDAPHRDCFTRVQRSDVQAQRLHPVKDFTLLILLFVLYVAVPSLFRCDQFVE